MAICLFQISTSARPRLPSTKPTSSISKDLILTPDDPILPEVVLNPMFNIDGMPLVLKGLPVIYSFVGFFCTFFANFNKFDSLGF